MLVREEDRQYFHPLLFTMTFNSMDLVTLAELLNIVVSDQL